MKYFIVSFLFLSTILSAHAQGFYIEAGTNICDLNRSPESSESPEFKLGYQIGLSKNFPLTRHLSFHPQINFAYKREVHIVDSPIFEGENTDPTPDNLILRTRQSFLEVPLNIRYTYDFKTISAFALAGPYCNFLLHDGTTGHLKYTDYESNNVLVKPDEYSLSYYLDYGVNFGLGLEKQKMLIKVTSGFGFYRKIILKYNEDVLGREISFESELHNLTYCISVGYRLF